jgi:hypothetical protein
MEKKKEIEKLVDFTLVNRTEKKLIWHIKVTEKEAERMINNLKKAFPNK